MRKKGYIITNQTVLLILLVIFIFVLLESGLFGYLWGFVSKEASSDIKNQIARIAADFNDDILNVPISIRKVGWIKKNILKMPAYTLLVRPHKDKEYTTLYLIESEDENKPLFNVQVEKNIRKAELPFNNLKGVKLEKSQDEYVMYIIKNS